MQRQPNPDDPAYRDQSKRKELEKKNTETAGSKLEKEGGYIDTGELDQEGRPSRYSSGEGSQEFLQNSLKIGASFIPDLTNPAELSETLVDTKATHTAAMLGGSILGEYLPIPKGTGAIIGGAVGYTASKLKRKAIDPFADFAYNKARRVWDDGLGQWVFKTGEDVGRTLEELYQNTQARIRGAGSIFEGGPGASIMEGAGTGGPSAMSGSGGGNWNKIPPEHRDYTKPVREVDKLARVNKTKIRKYVLEFGGNEDDVTRIFNEHALKQKNINQSRTWLNSYFKKLNEGLGPDGLRNARIKDIDGVQTLVDVATDKALPHADEVDHSKAKALMAELGLEGADFHENLDVVYTVFNRAKSDLDAIPDDILRATGQSTSLREWVQRSLDTVFNAKFTRVPERFRDVARQQILEDVLASTPIKGKPGKIRQQIIDKHLKFWEENSNLLVELDDYVPEEILKDVDFFADPQQAYETLTQLDVFTSLKPAFKKRVKRMTDQWVTLNRGTQAVRDYFERTGGRKIKKKYN